MKSSFMREAFEKLNENELDIAKNDWIDFVIEGFMTEALHASKSCFHEKLEDILRYELWRKLKGNRDKTPVEIMCDELKYQS